MHYHDIILLSLALAVDALIVSFSYGLVIKHHRMKNALGLGLSTGLGQFLMPLMGFLLTGSIHSYVARWDHWIAFSVFVILGGRVIWQAFSQQGGCTDDVPRMLSFRILLVTGIATSIDAFVAGASLYFSQGSSTDSGPGIVFCAALIGGITFACSFAGFLSARHLHRLPTKPLEIAAGLVLVGLGIKVLFEHLC